MQYGLIGKTLGHSYSKQIHEMLAEYTYDLIPLNEEEFHTFMKEKTFRALNVTIPYKCDVIPYLTEMDQNAKSIGAVNTIVNKNGKLYGHNTDYSGFLYTLEHNTITVHGKKIVVLGCGGASKAVLAVLRNKDAGEIIVVNRSPKEGTISYVECMQNHKDCDIIINTTPVGMYPNVDATPLDLTPFTNCEAVVDLIYNPAKTKLLKQANSLGMKAVNGLEMLVAQAKYAVEFFLETEIEDCKIEEVMNKLKSE